VVCVTSGKGGVGKTTTTASFSFGLGMRGYKTVAIDFDIGLRNLDIHLGMERRVIYDFISVIKQECNLRQALIQDKRNPNLYLLAASQTRDKSALKEDGVQRVINELKKDFDFIVTDSPAGIETGAFQAMYWCDTAVMCTNPEPSSCKDSDKMVGFILSNSRRAVDRREPVIMHLLVTRYDPQKVADKEMLSIKDIQELLGIPLLGVIPDSDAVLKCTNHGMPVIVGMKEDVSLAYDDAVARFLGEDRPMRFTQPNSFLDRLKKKILKI